MWVEAQLQNRTNHKKVMAMMGKERVHPLERKDISDNHIFREHNNIADAWAHRGADGRTESWVIIKRRRRVQGR